MKLKELLDFLKQLPEESKVIRTDIIVESGETRCYIQSDEEVKGFKE